MENLDDYHYVLPLELIAHEPASPRESAKLLVYHTATDTIEHRHIYDLPSLIARVHLVTNDTTVLPARVQGIHEDGTAIELLILVDQGVGEDGTVPALVNRGVKVGEKVRVGTLTFIVLDNREKAMRMSVQEGKEALLSYLTQYGETPLPPYIDSQASEATKRLQYQTVFAEGEASVAAPTASLHFTNDLLTKLTAAGVTISPVTLQVGLGTFAPIFPEHFASGKLHEEHYFVSEASAKAIQTSKVSGRKVLAVGTTMVRTLESAKVSVMAGQGSYGTTDLFIYPPYTFTVPDMLMTNFHVPRSSLMCLVEAFIAHKGSSRRLVSIYEEAIYKHYRFYSFGDAMLIM